MEPYIEKISDNEYSTTSKIKNLEAVFDTVISRPQLVFDNIKYCVLDKEVTDTKSILSHPAISKLLPVTSAALVRLTTGEVLCESTEQKIVGILSDFSFIVIVLDLHGKQLQPYCYLFVESKDLSCTIMLHSELWTIHPCITSCKSKKVVKWLTAEEFKLKLPPNNAVCPKLYYNTYNDLKDKYADEIFKAWDMQTDPSKFIHEDIGIAAYLICIWKSRYGDDAQNFVNFVDIGCGNGLLVYILNQEKFNGIGIDVKMRNIWKTLFSRSTYMEKFFDPMNWHELSECNWLIGNHSDELTPWLPYVASMISYQCEFFVLPCCPWNFSAKYSRTSASLSTYQCYLDFIESVILDFGFNHKRDTMKIPSTKRTCFVSNGRNYLDSELSEKQDVISAIIRTHSNSGNQKNVSCVVRSKEIQVRNGTKLNRSLCSEIVKFTAALLLKNAIIKDDVWCAGQPTHIKDIVLAVKDSIEFEKSLKNQDGGIQTVLRNFHQVFIVRNGMVSFRDWSKETKKVSSMRVGGRKYDRESLRKSKPCWFYDNHPQGCNLSAEDCNYAHGSEELKVIVFDKNKL